MTSLRQLFFEHDHYASDKYEHYLEIYESILEKLISRQQPINLLEIGVQNGGSLEIWAKYLPLGSSIVGIDALLLCAELPMPSNVRVIIADTTNSRTIDHALGPVTPIFDMIIDDGSHFPADVIATFENFFPRLAPGGFYVIEDLHCSYFPEYHGGLRVAESAIEWLKNLVDAVNVDHFKAEALEKLPPIGLELLRYFNRTVSGVSFYDSVAVIEKRREEKLAPSKRIFFGKQMHVFELRSTVDHVEPYETALSRGEPD